MKRSWRYLLLGLIACSGCGSGSGNSSYVDPQFVGTWTTGGNYPSAITIQANGATTGALTNGTASHQWNVSGTLHSPSIGGSINGVLAVTDNGQPDGTEAVTLLLNFYNGYDIELSNANGPTPQIAPGSNQIVALSKEQ